MEYCFLGLLNNITEVTERSRGGVIATISVQILCSDTINIVLFILCPRCWWRVFKVTGLILSILFMIFSTFVCQRLVAFPETLCVQHAGATAAPADAYIRKSYKTKNDNYCWSHGYQVGLAHTSANCTKKAPGNKDAATRDNTMGGETWGSEFI
jgi:hypothetical protein